MGGSQENFYEGIDDSSEDDIFQKLVREENKYINILKEIVEDIEKLEEEIQDKKLFYFFGNIDSILAYHEIQFLPDLENCNSTDEVINLFFKHKTLFYFYEDFIRIQPFFPQTISNYDASKKIFLVEINKSVVTKRLEEYIYFLENLGETYEVDTDRLDTAKIMLKNISEKVTEDEQKRFTICEIIVTERRYMKNLKDNLAKYKKYVFDVTGEYDLKREKLYGNLPQIYEQQKPLLESLEDCFFSLNIMEVMNSFLNNKAGYESYIGDQSLKCMDTIAVCNSNYPEMDSIIDYTSERLTKYVQFTNTLQKYYKDNLPAVKKIKEVENMFKDVIGRVNADIAISSIINENIDLGNQQGKFWSKDSFHISTRVDGISSRKLYTVFLFDKAVILTLDRIRNSRYQYEYVHHFLTKRLKLKTDIDNRCLILSDLKMNKDEDHYKLITRDNEKLELWDKYIKNILQEQQKEEKFRIKNSVN